MLSFLIFHSCLIASEQQKGVEIKAFFAERRIRSNYQAPSWIRRQAFGREGGAHTPVRGDGRGRPWDGKAVQGKGERLPES
jgi:hypothetical protein